MILLLKSNSRDEHYSNGFDNDYVAIVPKVKIKVLIRDRREILSFTNIE